MNNLKTAGVALVVSVLVVAIAFALTPKQDGGTPIPREKLGATPGNVIDGKYFTVGGVELAYTSSNMIATSSVPCVFKNPFATATTSAADQAALLSFSAIFYGADNGNVGGGSKVSLSTSTNQLLSSTSTKNFVFEYTLPASRTATSSLLWVPDLAVTTSTAVNGSKLVSYKQQKDGTSGYFLRSNEFVGLKVATSTPGASHPFKGKCSARWQKL